MLVKTHQPCEDCGSSDALAEYETNTYCFSCHRSRPKSIEKPFFPVREETNSNKINDVGLLELPHQSTQMLSMAAQQWLLAYHVYEDLVLKYNIRYVQYAEVNRLRLQNRVILPSYNKKGELMFYQARALDKKDSPKYYTIGSKEHLFWSQGPYKDNDVVVLVEDIISAIRVGEHVQAVSLIGTSLNQRMVLNLAEKYATIVIWMDGDKEGQRAATKLIKKFRLFSSNVYNIDTELDPKCLFNKDLNEEMRKCY